MRYLAVLALLTLAGCQAATQPSVPDLRVNCVEDFAPGDVLPNQCRKRTTDPIVGPQV